MGLLLIEKGKKKGHFKKYHDAIRLMNEGMNILIEKKHRENYEIGKIYLKIA
jgi:hypothetical protein